MDGRLPSFGWSATIPWMVNHNPKDKDGHPASPGWSPISLRLVMYYSKSPSQLLFPASQGWSPMIPSTVTHHPKILKSDKTLQLQLNKEFDTSAAQLVFSIFLGGTLSNLDPGSKGCSNFKRTLNKLSDKCQRIHITQNLFPGT